MSEARTAVVLCEDLQARVVLYRLLKNRWGKRFPRVRVLPLPAGVGCGSQYVREKYAYEVQAQRTSTVNQVLVVHIDGDNVGLAARNRDFARELSQAGATARGPAEAIAHVVPCWETETWILHAKGETVNETEAAPQKFRGREAAAAEPLIDLLVALVQGTDTAPDHLPSLGAVVPELRRL